MAYGSSFVFPIDDNDLYCLTLHTIRHAGSLVHSDDKYGSCSPVLGILLPFIIQLPDTRFEASVLDNSYRNRRSSGCGSSIHEEHRDHVL